jgi:hypothetical protein
VQDIGDEACLSQIHLETVPGELDAFCRDCDGKLTCDFDIGPDEGVEAGTPVRAAAARRPEDGLKSAAQDREPFGEAFKGPAVER